ncbi:MAG: PEP-CTERM sorting domain-containing protein [Pseudomonadota bacterium]|nr:PEP-CTERM sorting domain-containing protein [Pseudomonadota bacterium]
MSSHNNKMPSCANSADFTARKPMRRVMTNTARAIGAVLLGSAALICNIASAAVTFDSLSPDVYGGGATFMENGFLMTVQDSPAGAGFAGAIVNPADAFSCAIIGCPTGNTTQYFAGLNDGGIGFSRTDHVGFKLTSLDFAFVIPVAQPVAGSVGRLQISGVSESTGGVFQTSIEFPQQINGQYAFSNWTLASRFSNVVFSQLSISACIYDTDGGCYRPAENLAQFAIDNLNIAPVPEPSTAAMLALGLFGFAFVARRRRAD